MQPSEHRRERLDDEAFRAALRDVVARAGRSLRALSLAMGRDPGYLAALLDPSRPSRARPSPDDLVRLSDATGIPLVELFEALWGIPIHRFADELENVGLPRSRARGGDVELSAEDRRMVNEFARFLAHQQQRRGR